MPFPFTHEQQQLVDFAPLRCLVISGQAGSGKSVVLAGRAERFAHDRVLLITYNRALAAQTTDWLRQWATHSRNIEVRTMQSLAGRVRAIMGNGTPPEEREDFADPAAVIKEVVKANNGKIHERLLYDHVLIDEVQDFQTQWVMALLPMARQSLTVAGDFAQQIYARTFSWQDLGIMPDGEHELTGTFRTTAEIQAVANGLGHATPPGRMPETRGPNVVRIQRGRWWQARQAGVQHVKRLWQDNPNDRILVTRYFRSNVRQLCDLLNEHEVPAEVRQQRELGTWSDPGVTVSTLHQTKGLEFDHMVIFGLSDDNFPGFILQQESARTRGDLEVRLRNLLYVAMTRARQTVTVVGGNPFCRFFDGIAREEFDWR